MLQSLALPILLEFNCCFAFAFPVSSFFAQSPRANGWSALCVQLAMPAAVPDAAMPSASGYATSYDPNVQAYIEFQTQQKVQGLRKPESLPDGFPVSVTGPEAWTPITLQHSFVLHLSQLHCAEIDSACKYFSG